jgi:hypothetical protein
MNKAVKSSAQKRREKKLAKPYSLTNYFSCGSTTTRETENSAEFDDDDAKAKEDAEGILICR